MIGASSYYFIFYLVFNFLFRSSSLHLLSYSIPLFSPLLSPSCSAGVYLFSSPCHLFFFFAVFCRFSSSSSPRNRFLFFFPPILLVLFVDRKFLYLGTPIHYFRLITPRAFLFLEVVSIYNPPLVPFIRLSFCPPALLHQNCLLISSKNSLRRLAASQ